MKYFCIICFTIACSIAASAQSLEGVWQGHYTYDGISNYATSIALRIQVGAEGDYVIHSYTRLKSANAHDSIMVCNVSYKKIGKNSFTLQEYKFLNGDLGSGALQTMFLDFKEKKGKNILSGRWESPDELSLARKVIGRVTLTKQ